MEQLRKGYTTGVHTSWAFKNGLEILSSIHQKVVTKSVKIDNDDLDVTKGCQIVVNLSYNLQDIQINTITHKPYILTNEIYTVYVYAANGVGIVTKEGLKPPVGYPAINPVPLQVLQEILITNQFTFEQSTIFCSIGIVNGEQIAKKTANEKVGILGGLSILGTTGWVKPISATAYINSIQTEIGFIATNYFIPIVLTLGNSSYKSGLKLYNQQQIVQIGNFIYDSLQLCTTNKLYDVVLICGIGKLTKIAQGFKNTHNRFGGIDFELLQNQIAKELNFQIDTNITKTVKGVVSQLETKKLEKAFYEYIKQKSIDQITQWFPLIKCDIILQL